MPLRDDQSSDYSDDVPSGSDAGPTDDQDQDSPDEVEGTRPRDEHGRFLSPDDVDDDEVVDEELDEEVEDDDADIPFEDETEGPPEGDEVPAGAEAGGEPKKEAEYEPLKFRSGGQDYQINGSYLTEDGHAVIPKDHIEQILQLVSRGHHHQTTYLQELGRRDGRIRELEQQLSTKSQAEEEAEFILDFFAKLREKGRQGAIEWFDNLDQNWAVLQAESKASAAEARANALEARQNAARERDQGEEWESYQQESLERAIYREVARQYADAGLTDEDLIPVYRTLYHTRNAIIYRAQNDLYDNGQIVAKKGQVVIDYLPIREALGMLMSGRTRASQGAEAAANAARQNARRQGQRTPPPTVRTGRTTESQQRTKRRFVPKTREQADALLRMPVDRANALLRGTATGSTRE
jgi:hypothetical protein